MTSHAQRPGIALLMTLIGVLVLEVVIAGAFHVAIQQRRIATSYARGVQLQLAARSAAATALAGWPGFATEAIPLGGTTPVVSHETSGMLTATSLQRIAPTLFLLRAEARFPATEEKQAVAAILRELTAAEFLGGIRAAAVARAAVVTGTIDGSPPAECVLPVGAPAEVPGTHLQPLPGGEGATSGEPDRPFTEIAGLDLQGVVSAPPAVLVVPGDFTLAADLDEVVVIVSGNVSVSPGVQFRGLLLVGGSLRLQPGSSVSGAVQLGDLLTLEEAQLQYDPCVIAELFETHGFLRGPLRAAPHWWIPSA